MERIWNWVPKIMPEDECMWHWVSVSKLHFIFEYNEPKFTLFFLSLSSFQWVIKNVVSSVVWVDFVIVTVIVFTKFSFISWKSITNFELFSEWFKENVNKKKPVNSNKGKAYIKRSDITNQQMKKHVKLTSGGKDIYLYVYHKK